MRPARPALRRTQVTGVAGDLNAKSLQLKDEVEQFLDGVRAA